MMLENDRALLDAFRRGERWALEKVYRAYAPEVLAVLEGGFTFESRGRTFRFVGVRSRFQVEDFLHDVFLGAFSARARAQYDGLRPYGPYLRTIAKNLVLDELRRKEHALRVDAEVLPEPGEADLSLGYQPEGPEEAAQRRQLEEHVRRFVADLPEREREVHRLRFHEGLQQREAAQLLKLSVSKIKTSEKRIRALFQDYLERHGWLSGSPAQEEAS